MPHGLAIIERGDVCVADRENMRVICMSLRTGLGMDSDDKRGPPLTLQQPDLGRVFAVAAHGNVHSLIIPLVYLPCVCIYIYIQYMNI